MTRLYVMHLDSCYECPCYYRTNAFSPSRGNHYCGYDDDKPIPSGENGTLAAFFPDWCPLPEVTSTKVTK